MKENLDYALYKLKEGWRSHERNIVLFVGVLLVGVIGFEVGLVQGKKVQSKPLVVEVPSKPSGLVAGVMDRKTDSGSSSDSSSRNDTVDAATGQKCAFVGSKNSDKYHLPSCAVAKRIKEANKVCFGSEEEARAKGYMSGCLK